MKRYISVLLMAVFICGLYMCPVFAQSYQYEEPGLIIETENMFLDKASWNVVEDDEASCGTAVEAKKESVFKINGTIPKANDTPTLSLSFSVPDSKIHYIWVRYCAISDGSDSVFFGMDDNAYGNKMFNQSNSYEWVKFYSGTLEKGNHTMKFIERERLLKIDQIVITTNSLFVPTGILTDTKQISDNKLISKWDEPPVNPPEKAHPRVYFTEKDKERILMNLSSEEHSRARELFLGNASKTISEDKSKYESSIINILESKALYYSLYGDKKIGQKAIELGKSVFNYDLSVLEMRSKGRIINVMAEMYDWCYDLLSDEEKNIIISECVKLAGEMEINWPPSWQSAATGHGSEAQFLRDILSFSIAVYDERPDIWNYVGGRFYAEYVPVRQFANKGFYNHQGTNYGYYRHQFDSYAYMLITGMGAEEPYSGEDLSRVSYSQMYMRRPDGTFLSDGDIYERRTPEFGYAKADIAGLLLDASISNDPYIKNEYYRQTMSVNKGKICQTYVDNSPVLYLIVNNPDIETKTLYDMPLSMYYPDPVGMMVARTGWKDGVRSDSVVASMKIGGYMFNNHQHLDAGSFQVYYKGILATESGEYDSYGSLHHKMYTSKSIAHNTMLVYDPSEDKNNTQRNNINDGGQRAVNSYGEFATLDKLLSSNAEVGKVIAHETDAKNEKEPNYTYIKGDLTNAYTDKVSDFKRSFMFINTKDKSVPAAMIVFDKLKVSNPEFKKIWLMHGEQRPSISGNKSVFVNKNDFGYDGKMQIDTLLPKQENTEISVEGGPEDGWSVVNKHIYNGEGWSKIKIADYTGSDLSENNEANTYRLEISPKIPSEQDYFLNVIQLGDADSERLPDANLFEDELFYGTKIDSKTVLFSKSGELICDNFSIKGNGGQEYIICDIEDGKYAVTDDNGTTYVYSSKDGGILNFTANGNVRITKTNEFADVNIMNAESDNENDSAYIKYNDKFLYVAANPVKINNKDDFFVPLSMLEDNFDVYVRNTEQSVRLFRNNSNEFIAKITPNENIVTFFGTKESEQKPYIDTESGEIMIPIRDIAYALGFNVTYDKYSKIIFIEDVSISNTYINYVPVSNGIKINIFEESDYRADYFSAAYNNSRLLSTAKLEKSGGDMYSGIISTPDNVTDIKIFSWDISTMFPLRSSKSLTPLPGKATVYSTADRTLKISHSAGIKYTESDHDIIQYEKISDKNEERFLIGTGNVYLGYETDRRWLYYSSVIESTNIAEPMQIRIRSNIAQKVLYAFTPTIGKKYKLDTVLDLQEMKAYIYIDGKCVNQNDISSLKGSKKAESVISWIEHYYTGSKTEGGIRTVQNAFVAIYDESISIDKIEQGIINGILVVEDSNES